MSRTSRTRAHVARRAFAIGVAGALVVATGCSDFSAPDDPAFGLPDIAVAQPTLSGDVQPIFSKRCTIGGCHSLAARRAGLVLTPDSAYVMLVNRVATERPDLRRVLPGSPESSWLWIRVQPDQSLRGSFPRMPLAAHPLTPNQIATIANWIARGAPQD